MGKLTTHVLDTAAGEPADGVVVRLYRDEILLMESKTNCDGRCDQPLLDDAAPGNYRLVFCIGDYFRTAGVPSPFLDEVPVQFILEGGRDCHIPLACSPFSYSTYRGS